MLDLGKPAERERLAGRALLRGLGEPRPGDDAVVVFAEHVLDTGHLARKPARGLAEDRDTCLRRVWRAEHFSYWMTNLLHRDPAGDPFEHRLRLSHLRYITHSRAAAASLAENYVGLAPV